jgi:hypothetical protein
MLKQFKSLQKVKVEMLDNYSRAPTPNKRYQPHADKHQYSFPIIKNGRGDVSE